MEIFTSCSKEQSVVNSLIVLDSYRSSVPSGRVKHKSDELMNLVLSFTFRGPYRQVGPLEQRTMETPQRLLRDERKDSSLKISI